MLFPTVEFAIFFALVFALSWAAHRVPLLRKVILLVASYIFYAWWDWRFSFLLLECSLATFIVGLWIDSLSDERSRRRATWFGVALNLAVLAYFKYWGFFLASAN